MSISMDIIDPLTTLFTPETPNQSELIILCTWLGALPKHTSKYIALYQAVAPHTPILHLASNIWSLTARYDLQRQKVQDAVSVVLRTLSEAEGAHTAPKILIHTFSNGGTNAITQLLIVLQEKRGMSLPVHSILCDSGPAKGEYWKSYRAMRLSLPKSYFFNLTGAFIVHFIVSVLYASIIIGKYEAPETLIRRTLLDASMVTERKKRNKRIVYLWSKTDELVDWRDVLEHSKEAQQKGWITRSEEFEMSPHCGHMRMHAERYRDIIEQMWKE